MPTPRMHGGAALRYIPLNTPGFLGLNKQAVGTILGPEWATRLENTIIDNENRVAARKGWSNRTNTTAAGDDIEQLHEEQSTGDLFASAADNKIYRSQDGGDTWSDVTGSATVTDSAGQFHDFNGSVLYVQSGQKPTVYSGTSFANVADANAPTGGVSLASFGRVWGVTSTGKSLRYSALLDETTWTGSDTGLIDLTSVWQGDDTIKALANFNGQLVIFGARNIVVYTDGQGSALGVDPLYLYVADTLSGIGCIARDSVQQIDGDIWFISQSGLMSFGRLIQERSNPLRNVSRHVQDYLGAYLLTADLAKVRAVYSSKDRFYLLSLPSDDGTSETGVAFCFDTRAPSQDGSFRCGGVWTGLVPRAAVAREGGGGDLLMSLLSEVGEVGAYSDYLDVANTYIVEYESGWNDMGDPHVKLPKRINGLLFVGGNQQVTYKWAFDFVENFKTATVGYGGAGSVSEWGVAEYGIGEYNTGVQLVEKNVSGRKSGEHIKIGLSTAINGFVVAIQQLSVYAKTGRLR